LKKFLTGLLIIICLLGNTLASQAQVRKAVNDSVKISETLHQKTHSPKKASIYSALFPGLGQIYNGKYWKLPIIYGGFAGLIYGFSWNNNLYNDYFEAYRTISQYSSPGQLTAKDKAYLDKFINNPSIDLTNPSHFNYVTKQLQSGKDFYRRNRDLTIIGMFALHVLNIIDASVDANFFDYDISDDLSMRIQPAPINLYGRQTVGVKVNIKF
jgi:TM2 domain-containing membrane protein YozV